MLLALYIREVLTYLLRWALCLAVLVMVCLLFRLAAAVWLYPHPLPTAEMVSALMFGLRFDLAVAAFLSLALIPFIYTQRFHGVCFVLLSLCVLGIIAVFVGDIAYFQDTGKHVTYEAQHLMQSVYPLLQTLLFQHTAVFGIGVAIAGVVWLALYCLYRYRAQLAWRHQPSVLAISSSLLVLVCCVVVLVRGGFINIALKSNYVYYAGNVHHVNVATNPVYQQIFRIMERLVKPDAVDIHVGYAGDAYTEVMNILPVPQRHDALPSWPRANIIVVLLESWHIRVISQRVTPNFLAIKGIRVQRMVTDATRTTEGLFSTFCSYANPLGSSITAGDLMFYDYNCLPSILRNSGYSSAFIQGTHRDTSAVGAVSSKLGFSHSYGREEIHTRKYPLHAWGLYDQDIYNFAIKTISRLAEPFIIGINTNTTHNDELLPQHTPLINATREQQVFHFADIALGDFLRDLKKLVLQRPMVLVFVADHTKSGGSLSERFSIPVVIALPDHTSTTLPLIAHQRDIAATLLDILGLPAERSFTGVSLFNPQHHYSNIYADGALGWSSQNFAITSNVFNGAEDCYTQAWLAQIPCAPPHAVLRQQATAFVAYTQGLLYTGNTKLFGDPITRNHYHDFYRQ